MEENKGPLYGRRILIFLAAVCAAAVLLMAWALHKTENAKSTAFVPPAFDENAVQGTPEDVPESLGYSQLDAQAYRVSVCGAPVIEDSSAVVYLTSPEENGVWLKVRILDDSGKVLGESGLVRPGEYVRAVTLLEIPEEDTQVTLKIMAYEPDTYQSAGAAALNTTLYVS